MSPKKAAPKAPSGKERSKTNIAFDDKTDAVVRRIVGGERLTGLSDYLGECIRWNEAQWRKALEVARERLQPVQLWEVISALATLQWEPGEPGRKAVFREGFEAWEGEEDELADAVAVLAREHWVLRNQQVVAAIRQ